MPLKIYIITKDKNTAKLKSFEKKLTNFWDMESSKRMKELREQIEKEQVKNY